MLLIFSALPAMYLSLIHQRGTIDIMRSIEHVAREYRDDAGHCAKFLILMPCHSTPLYSHVHQKNVTLRFLTCEPNFNNNKSYRNEAEQFYINPAAWLQSNILLHSKLTWPTHVVL